MKVLNPLKMNDWEIKKFLFFVVLLQLTLLGLIGLDTMGITIPVLREFISFIYLAFIPGVLVLRILRLHKLTNIETLLYTVGLSITTVMFTGFFVNFAYPYLGISGPISLWPMTITLGIVVLMLCLISYLRDRGFADPEYIDLGEVTSPPVLFLCSISVLSIFGAYMVNSKQNNIILMALLIILAVLPILVASGRLITKKLYPLTIFVITISLLFHTSLISAYITGWDINTEYYLANLVLTNFHWDPSIYQNVDAMLSIVMLGPIFSLISGMDLTWVFKIIYPILFSLVPVGLYYVYERQTNETIAFFSCFFFVSIFTFYTEMIALARQQTAEIFFVLLLLLLVTKRMNFFTRSLLFVIFGISLSVSHYGLSYIYIIGLIGIWLLSVLSENRTVQKIIAMDGRNDKREKPPSGMPKITYVTIVPIFILIFIMFVTMWYRYMSSSSCFDIIVQISVQVAKKVFTGLFSSNTSQALQVITGNLASPMRNILKYLNFFAQFLIIAGILSMLKPNNTKFKKEFILFSLIFLIICFLAIALPYVSSFISTTRIYHITLYFLAPFFTIGGTVFFGKLARLAPASWKINIDKSVLMIISILLAIFLLFNSGFVYEIVKDHPGSIALSQASVAASGNANDINNFYASLYQDTDVTSADWLSNNRNVSAEVYSDYARKTLILKSYGMIPDAHEFINLTCIGDNSYVYLGYPNVRYSMAFKWDTGYYNITDISQIYGKKNLVYSNGDAKIYY